MIRYRMIGPINYTLMFLALLRVTYVCVETLAWLRGKAELLQTGKPLIRNLLYCCDTRIFARCHYKFISVK
jgi:hypothetical protein